MALVQQAGAMCADESAPLIAAQIEQESGWNAAAVSPAGAQGIAQFMPGTWAMYGGGGNPFDPAAAIPAQGRLMCTLFAQVRSAMASGAIRRGTATENALAAYNAGLGNVLAAGGFPTGIAETDGYSPRIIALAAKYTAAPAVAASGQGGAAVAAAVRYTGYPYVWGGGNTAGPTGYLWSTAPPIGFDCEGLTRYAIYQGYGVDIGAGTTTQLSTSKLVTVASRAIGQPDPLGAMAPGDVVLMDWGGGGQWGHVALYMGGGQFIHAPTTGETVVVRPASWFSSAAWVVRRVK